MLSVAMAYDFCYDAWPKDFRLRVLKEIQDYNKLPVDYDKFLEGHKGMATMDVLVNSPFPPRSNHFGAYIGGAGIALLAIRNDPGADMDRIDPWLKKIEKQMIRGMTEGFGDKGFYAEGHGPSHMFANNAFVPLLQAARVSWGKDFITPRSNGQWITLRWAMEIIPHGSKAWYPNYKVNSYGDLYKLRGPMSEGGDWSQGFGALANDDQKAAMLWMYENAIEKTKPLKEFDAWTYPHRAVFALINWPIGLEPKNPAEVLGHANADKLIGHFMFRKQWKDNNDVYVTFLLNTGPRRGHVRSSSGGNITFYGHGIREHFWARCNKNSKITHYEAQDDGSGVVAFSMEGQDHSVAVDFSDVSGTEGVVVVANPWFDESTGYFERRANAKKKLDELIAKGKAQPPKPRAVELHVQHLDGDTNDFFVMAMHKNGEKPEIKLAGNTLQVGGQAYTFDGKKLSIDR